jgi:cytochrome P450
LADRPANRWDYLPFHGGQRICIGQQFALTQIAYVLFRVLQRFQAIEARDDGKVRLLYGLTVSFAHGCPVSMTPA